MLAGTGIAVVCIAMLSWGMGDFLIQKSARKLGDWETLFAIVAFGTVILIPFVWKTVPLLFLDPKGLAILVGSALVLTIAAILTFEALKEGKIAVVEPIWPLEIPAASILAFAILGDRITSAQVILVVALIVGLILVSFRGRLLSWKHFAEKGIYIAFAGSVLMGFADFLLGWGSRVTDPVTANFVLNVVMTVVCGSILALRGRARHTIRGILENRGLLLMMAISDNIGWLAYAFAMTVIPIAIATGISESSVIIAVLLGIFMNHEKLERHQKAGLVIALASAVTLAFLTV
jgi:uncharacterized membrane protein